MTYYFIAANKILAVKTNIKNFKWSYGINVPEGTRDEYEKCKVKIHLVLEDFNEDHVLKDLGKYHYFSGAPGADKLYYTRDLAGKGKMRIKAENFLGDEPKITVNKNYYRLITHRIMNLHSIGYILTDLASLLLLRKGFAPIHCSAFKKDNSTVTVFAPPDTGKTLSSMTACMEHGARFIAEDLAVTDGTRIYSVPWTSTFRYYSSVEQSMGAKIKNRAAKILPPLAYLDFSKPEPITNYVDGQSLLDNEVVTHVAILERGNDEISLQSGKDAVRKLLNLNRYEFNYLRSPLLTAYEFFNPGLQIDEGLANEKAILSKLVANSEKVFAVRKMNATHYAQALIDEMEQEVPVEKTAVPVG